MCCVVHGSLVRTVLEGRLSGKKGRGKPKEMLLGWLLETSDENMDYLQLKKLAQRGQDGVELLTKNVNLPVRQKTTATAVCQTGKFEFAHINSYRTLD